MYARFEVLTKRRFDEPRGAKTLAQIRNARVPEFQPVRSIRIADVAWLHWKSETIRREALETAAAEALLDSVVHEATLMPRELPEMAAAHAYCVEKRLHPGMTDNRARTFVEALEIVTGQKLDGLRAATGSLYFIESESELSTETLERLAAQFLYNAEIELIRWHTQPALASLLRFEPTEIARVFPHYAPQEPAPERIHLSGLKDTELQKLSRDRLLSLSLAEMKAIQAHFAERGAEPTDVELEVLAQTWSEHCKHKIFAAEIDYVSRDPQDPANEIPARVDGLFKTTIRGTTTELPKPWLLSVFSDNAGIVAFDTDHAVCIKVETHNSPSALDPYGGAMTGIVGVNRDILGCGLGARPIFNTNVFCTAPLDYADELPERILHPRRVLEGVRHGVEAGGNQSGIPTVNGALVFDSCYLGKPLVFCGSGGILPRKIAGRDCAEKKVLSGDLIVMAGGRIGKDGIHGATFSSLEMTEKAPASAVQIGDPITQKRLTDFLLEARDRGLYRAVTDNGAGGLSSSVGEMAQFSNGARLDIALAPTKYPGLAAWEKVVSESQERMTFAVPADQWPEFDRLAQRHGTEVTAVGEFTDDGNFRIYSRDTLVGELPLSFLHGGAPRLKLRAEWNPPAPRLGKTRKTPTVPRAWVEVAGLPNIRSKEDFIRQYDHEVQGTSVVKPMTQKFAATKSPPRTGPNDAAVLELSPGSSTGIAVACGILPELSKVDAYLMAQASVDEAVRNLLAVGAEFSLGDETVLSLVDNFCWPDPVNHAGYAADLVRACYGIRKASLELKAPFISGKDSMKNDYRGKLAGQPLQISVTPTLLITALGRVPDYARRARTADFKSAGDAIYLLGPHQAGLLGSQWAKLGFESPEPLRAPVVDWNTALRLYSWLGSEASIRLRSCHDVSEGGLLTALFESALTGGFGAKLSLAETELGSHEFCFGESLHSFVVSVASSDRDALEHEWTGLGIPFRKIGTVAKTPEFDSKLWSVSLREIEAAWRGALL